MAGQPAIGQAEDLNKRQPRQTELPNAGGWFRDRHMQNVVAGYRTMGKDRALLGRACSYWIEPGVTLESFKY